KQSTDQKPYYVIEKRIADNTLVVSHIPNNLNTEKSIQTIKLRDYLWTSTRQDLVDNITAQIRYHGELINAKVLSEDKIELSYKGVISEGQSLVLYRGETLVGGGVIDKVL
ncbi:MAG: tRNA-specific 2-thiouridylase MnmA, partial [Patescibacteria group bacterium]|nr:tRNA-specific 2-thiouridylase MnmA [Patescibacteria group bacterium]